MQEHHYKHEDERLSDQKGTRQNSSGNRRMNVRAKDTPGVIYVEHQTHENAIVIMGSLTVDFQDAKLCEWIEQELEAAASDIARLGGKVGHIKATLTITSSYVIYLKDDRAATKEPPDKRGKITLTAIVRDIEHGEAVEIIRRTLVTVRARLRQEK